MTHRKRNLSFLPAAAMLVMILDSRTAVNAAAQGIELCLKTVIPSLFPMMILSSLLIQSIGGQSIKLLRPIEALCGIPFGAGGIYLTGLIGGYPIGAKCVSDAYKKKHLSYEEASHMLSFCNNPGPSFLFGICTPLFSSSFAVWMLWIIQIVSSIITGFILRKKEQKTVQLDERKTDSITQIVTSCIHTMAIICGWIIIFRIIIAFSQAWILWLLPAWGQVLFSGMLELTNGCCGLSQITEESVRFILCSIMLSFGGICVGMQTSYVSKGFSEGSYFKGKLIQTAVTAVLSALICIYMYPISFFPKYEFILTPFIFLLFFTVLLKLSIAFLKRMRYNTVRNRDKRSNYAVSEKNRAGLFLLPIRRKSRR